MGVGGGWWEWVGDGGGGWVRKPKVGSPYH